MNQSGACQAVSRKALAAVNCQSESADSVLSQRKHGVSILLSMEFRTLEATPRNLGLAHHLQNKHSIDTLPFRQQFDSEY